jgi:gliding motility-associated-like protein
MFTVPHPKRTFSGFTLRTHLLAILIAVAIEASATPPILTLSSESPENTNLPFVVVFKFNEVVNGFGINDIIVTNGEASRFEVFSSFESRALITPTSPGPVIVTVPAGAAKDSDGNNSNEATLIRNFDNAAPTGYSISFNVFQVNETNVSSQTISINNAEVGATYAYSITSDKGGEPLMASGSVTEKDFSIPSLNFQQLEDGTLTASLILTDPIGNKGNPATSEVIKKTALEEIFVFNAFSPNGDGINDLWLLPTLARYKDIHIQVFDRSGELVFSTHDPLRAWDGKNQKGVVLTGSYFYVINAKDTGVTKRGLLTLLKE